MTTMYDARRLARNLMDQHGLDHWRFEFDNARRRAGCCHWSEKKISLSKHFVHLNDTQRIRQTMLHEIAHALVGASHGHDAVWRRKCLAIGGDGKRRFDADSTAMPPSKYVGVCNTNPAHVYPRHKMTQAMRAGHLLCGKCGVRGTTRGQIAWSLR